MASVMLFPKIARAMLLTMVTIINLASTTLMCMAIIFGSGGRFEGISMGLNGFASLLPAAYWLHKIVFMDDYLIVRSLATFGTLSLISFATLLTLLIRNNMEERTALVKDFALLDNPATIAKAVIALALLNTFLSVMGVLVSCMGWVSQRVERGRPVYRNSRVLRWVAARNRTNQPVWSIDTSSTYPRVGLDIKEQGSDIALSQSPSKRFRNDERGYR